jgi:hypothetical protein
MFGWLRREPARLIEHRSRTAHALTDYPIYEPPYRQSPNFLRHLSGKSDEESKRLLREFLERGRENFVHLVDHRHERLTALRKFLTKFEVSMGTDDEGLAAVSAWLPHNCWALVANYRHTETHQKFFQHLEPWTGRWRGFNVIFDLGVFFGECITDRNPRLHWIYMPGASEDGRANHTGYGIAGFRNRRDDGLDPMGRIYRECANDEAHLRFGGGRFNIQVVRAETLVGIVRDFSTR